MTFEEILDQAIAMLQRRGRLTYSTLKRQFQLDEDALSDLKDELIYGQRLAVDEAESSSGPAPLGPLPQPPQQQRRRPRERHAPTSPPISPRRS